MGSRFGTELVRVAHEQLRVAGYIRLHSRPHDSQDLGWPPARDRRPARRSRRRRRRHGEPSAGALMPKRRMQSAPQGEGGELHHGRHANDARCPAEGSAATRMGYNAEALPPGWRLVAGLVGRPQDEAIDTRLESPMTHLPIERAAIQAGMASLNESSPNLSVAFASRRLPVPVGLLHAFRFG